MRLVDIYDIGGELITELIKREHNLQGHYLTGTLVNSLNFQIIDNRLVGYAVDYATIVNAGRSPGQTDFRKQYPALIRYFILRGYPEQQAKRFAFLTIAKWQREGMPTEASSAYSKTGERTRFIDIALSKPELDEEFGALFDSAVDEEFRKSKNETI